MALGKLSVLVLVRLSRRYVETSYEDPKRIRRGNSNFYIRRSHDEM